MRRLYKAVLAFSIVPGVLVLDDDLGFVTAAQAVIGRPFTPLSVAGVARRATRRAYRGAYYYGGAAAVAGAAAGAYYYGGGYPYQYGTSGYPYQYGASATRISTERPATRISMVGTIGTADTVTHTATEHFGRRRGALHALAQVACMSTMARPAPKARPDEIAAARQRPSLFNTATCLPPKSWNLAGDSSV
jgi:hypothetical protein